MPRLAVLLSAIVLLGISGCSIANAAVRPYEKLSLDEKIALKESERRVALYDHELTALDRQRIHHKISAGDYQWSNQELVFCIQQESLFQNAILVRSSDLPERARAVLETMEHGALMVPIGIGYGVGYVVATCPSVLQFLACIH